VTLSIPPNALLIGSPIYLSVSLFTNSPLTACFIDSGGCPNAVKTLATFGLSNVAKAFVKDSVPPFSLTAFIKPSLELP